MSDEIRCPYCHRSDRQVKAGLQGDVQRYKCLVCSRRYTPVKQPRGYPEEVRNKALELYAGGMKVSHVARQLDINVNSVHNWIRNSRMGQLEGDDIRAVEPVEIEPVAPVVKRRSTIVDVAEAAGVSVSSVSNYLNNQGKMRAATRQRIAAAIAELRFTPNSLIRAIRHGRTGIVGVITHGLFNLDALTESGLGPPILSGISAGVEPHHFHVLLYIGPYHLPGRTGIPFLNGQIDGLIWAGPRSDAEEMYEVADGGLPLMVLLSRVVPDNAGYVIVDNVGAMRQMVAHLTGLGHRRIAFAGSITMSDFVDRREGYRMGLSEQHIPYDPRLVASNAAISTNWYSHKTTDYEKAINKWLALPDPPTAIMLTTDGWAAWVIERLRARGVRVPEDIAVTGFDDSLGSDTICGGITTVRQPFHEIGRIGADRLAALINGEDVESCRVVVPAELVIRASTVRTGDSK